MSFNDFDLQAMVIIAINAVLLRLLDVSMAPMLMGFILGGLMETNLRLALTIHDGSIPFLCDRPISLIISVIALFFLLLPLIRFLLQRQPYRRV